MSSNSEQLWTIFLYLWSQEVETANELALNLVLVLIFKLAHWRLSHETVAQMEVGGGQVLELELETMTVIGICLSLDFNFWERKKGRLAVLCPLPVGSFCSSLNSAGQRQSIFLSLLLALSSAQLSLSGSPSL